jgi:hypothetical protein
MKKFICILIVLVIAVSAVGCSGSSTDNKASKTSQQGVADILSSAAETQPDSSQSATAPATIAPKTNIKYPELDYEAEVDLTVLNSNMVYSEVAAMVSTPEKYIGKTVKMNGTFDVYTDIKTGKYYYSCIIQDATACCSSGIEFSWKGEHKFPEDYPAVGTPLTVGGVFETYPEGDKQYCRLKDAEVVFAA